MTNGQILETYWFLQKFSNENGINNNESTQAHMQRRSRDFERFFNKIV